MYAVNAQAGLHDMNFELLQHPQTSGCRARGKIVNNISGHAQQTAGGSPVIVAPEW